MSRTHWKKTIDKDWIGCYILPESGKPDDSDRKQKPPTGSNPFQKIEAKLLRVEYKKVKVKGKEDMYKIAYFEENYYVKKPMLLSATENLKRVAKFTGSDFIEDWGDINADVYLQAEWDKAFGSGYDWALRIAFKPKKVELKEGTVDWTSAVKYVDGGGDPANLRAKKIISDELFKKLEDARPKE